MCDSQKPVSQSPKTPPVTPYIETLECADTTCAVYCAFAVVLCISSFLSFTFKRVVVFRMRFRITTTQNPTSSPMCVVYRRCAFYCACGVLCIAFASFHCCPSRIAYSAERGHVSRIDFRGSSAYTLCGRGPIEAKPQSRLSCQSQSFPRQRLISSPPTV